MDKQQFISFLEQFDPTMTVGEALEQFKASFTENSETLDAPADDSTNPDKPRDPRP